MAKWGPWVCCVLGARVASAESKTRDYELLDPVPASELRALAYGMTPFTVDAGHVQVELAVASTAWDASSGNMTKTTSFGAFELKLGLTNRTDLELVVSPWMHVSRLGSNLAGVGDSTARVKISVFGNETNSDAVAVVPYVVVPTGQDLGANAFFGGVVVPMTMSLPLEVSGALALDACTQVQEASNRTLTLHATARLTHLIAGAVSGFVENIATTTGGSSDLIAHVGATLAGVDQELDAGVMFDPFAPTERYNPYVAITLRR